MHNKTKTKHRMPTLNGRYKKQRINNNRTAALERTAALAIVWGGGAKMHFTGYKSSPYILLLLKHKYCLAHMDAS